MPDEEQPEHKETQDLAYWQGEAKKAFETRDKIKKELSELKSNVLTKEDRELFETLKTERLKAEEEKAKKAGEWDTLRKQLADKHAVELAERDAKVSTLSDRFKHSIVRAEFGAASDYFGGDKAKTILDVDLAMAALSKYVVVEDVESDPLGYRIVVKKPNGDTILGRDGEPAPFGEAMGELIATLPNKDRILRGSGKTGSGSSGASSDSLKDADLDDVIRRARAGDKEAVKSLKARTGAQGGLVMGTAFGR